jgi:hypothetical protein
MRGYGRQATHPRCSRPAGIGVILKPEAQALYRSISVIRRAAELFRSAASYYKELDSGENAKTQGYIAGG